MTELDIGINARRARQGGREAEQAVDRVGAAAHRANNQLRGLDGRFKAGERSARGFARSMRGVALGFSAFAAVSGAARALGGFEESMARVQGVAIRASLPLEEQARLFERLEGTARELGATTAFTSSQAAEGLLNLSRAGFDVGESIDAISPTLNLALGQMVDLGTAADIVSSSIRQFGLEADAATRVVDVLTGVSNRTNTNLVQLAEGFKLAGPLGRAAGLSFEETAAALGILADSALKGTIGGTNLRGVLIGLLDPTTAGAEVLAQLTEEELKQAGTLQNELLPRLRELNEAQLTAVDALDLFNRRSVAGGLALIDNAEKFAILTEEIERNAGEADRVSALIGDTLPKQYAALQSAIEAVVLETGDDGLTGALKDSTRFLTLGTRALVDYEDGLTEVERRARGVVIAIGVTGLLGALTAVAALIGPAGIMVAGIGAVVGALDLFIGAGDRVTEAVQDLRREFRGMADDLTELELRLARALEAQDFDRAAQLARTQAQRIEDQIITLQRLEQEGETTVPLTNFRRQDGQQGFQEDLFRNAVDQEIARLEARADEFRASIEFAQREQLNPLGISNQQRGLETLEAEIQSLRGALAPEGFVGPVQPISDDVLGRLTVTIGDAIRVAEEERSELLGVAVANELSAFQKRTEEAEAAAAEAAEQPPPTPIGQAGSGRGGIDFDDFAASIADAQERLREFQESQREALADFAAFGVQLAEDASLARESAAIADREAAVIDQRNRLREVGIELDETELNLLRDLITLRQQAEIETRVREGFGQDLAASIVDPVRQGLLNGEWDEVGAQVAIRFGTAVLDNVVLGPASDALSRLFEEAVGLTNLDTPARAAAEFREGVGEAAAEDAVGLGDRLIDSGGQFSATVTGSGTTFAGSIEGAGASFLAAVQSAALEIQAGFEIPDVPLDAEGLGQATESVEVTTGAAEGATAIAEGVEAAAITEASVAFGASVTSSGLELLGAAGQAGTAFTSAITTAAGIFEAAVSAAAAKLAIQDAGSTVGAAKGAVFTPTRFAAGAAGRGSLPEGVLQRPAEFALQGGGRGEAGELGREGILPLGQTPDGRLGVLAVGGGRGQVTFNDNSQTTFVVRDEEHMRRTQDHIDSDKRADFMRTLEP